MESEFCGNCGSILPQVSVFSDKVVCYCCKDVSDMREGSVMEYRIIFNQRQEFKESEKDKEAAEGPVIERVCSKCGFDKMSYATLQLRSADEGQTVFFTCVRCK